MATGLTKKLDLTAPAPAGVFLPGLHEVIPGRVEIPEDSLDHYLVEQRGSFIGALRVLDRYQQLQLNEWLKLQVSSSGKTEGTSDNVKTLPDSGVDELRYRTQDIGSIWRRESDRISHGFVQEFPGTLIRDDGSAIYFTDRNGLYRWGDDDSLVVYKSFLEQREADYGIRLADEAMWEEFLLWGFMKSGAERMLRKPGHPATGAISCQQTLEIEGVSEAIVAEPWPQNTQGVLVRV